MSKWLNQFLENEIVNRSDKSDRFEKDANLSGLSGRSQGLLDEKKVENNLRKGGDKSDRFKFESNMSPLSLRTPGLLNENLEKVGNNTSKGGDKSDGFKLRANMSPTHNEGGLLSVLSVPTPGVFDQNLENMPKPKSDKTNAGDLLLGSSGSPYGLFGKTAFTFSNGSDLLDEYEERIAIAEYDGHQSATQAERIAYLDAFIAVLVTLPYEESDEDCWLSHRIRATQAWLVDQGIMQPK